MTGAGVEAEEMKQKAYADIIRRIGELMMEARSLSGDPHMEPLQALAYLAKNGHEEASAFLSIVTRQDFEDIITAAAEHPDWELEGFNLRCTDETCAENTTDKLLTWYRRKHGAA